MSAEQVKTEIPGEITNVSETSQTAQEFINSQLQLEADAREALPYAFDTCTRPLGALRQSLFSCLTCNPPPKNNAATYRPAGVCYSCSISCHGEHELVELFNKRNFVCDCGTTRLPSTSPCSLRISVVTGTKGGVHSELPAAENKYNQNFSNQFCTCGEVYDANKEQGTMFQCLGLGTVDTVGCGEDWYHPECIMGLPRNWKEQIAKRVTQIPADADGRSENTEHPSKAVNTPRQETSRSLDNVTTSPAGPEAKRVNCSDDVTTENSLMPIMAAGASITSQVEDADGLPNADLEGDVDEDNTPPGFPHEDDFEDFICYRCVDANPWIKRYASSAGFLPAIPHQDDAIIGVGQNDTLLTVGRKRKISLEGEDDLASQTSKRQRGSEEASGVTHDSAPESPTKTINEQDKPNCSYTLLPPALSASLSLFTKEGFREHLCRCPQCYPRLARFPQLLEEEDTYEPPISEDEDEAPGSLGSRSLLDRGEAALSNVDRVRAIEGVMVYNHLKDKVKSFLKPFAESGQAVGAEDIKKYFEGLRGDSDAISAAARKSTGRGSAGGDGGSRTEQSGY